MRAALYLRVSSDRQTVECQRADLDRLAAARGLDIVAVFEEIESAAKRRPKFETMMNAAHRGEYAVVVIWALDRFGRSMIGNVQDVLALDRLGVQVVSVREPWLDTGGPVRQLLLAIFSWVAEQERERLIERTRAGIERARREGKRLGRRPRQLDLDHALELRAEGRSLRSVASELGVPTSIVHRALSVPPSGLCALCGAEVHVDMHGRARWHGDGQGAVCAGVGHAVLPLPVPKTSPEPATPAA